MTETLPDPEPRHVPVLPSLLLEFLQPQPGEIWVDATVGAGGHAQLILERIAPTGRLIALDQDESMLELAKSRLHEMPVNFHHASFDQLRAVLNKSQLEQVDGVVADLGFCSDQLEDPARGLSFLQEGPLDMRMNPAAGQPASELVNRLSESALARIFREFGEERHSRRVARKIVERRGRERISTTTQLAELVRSCMPRRKTRGPRGIDPATRVFQALRIAVNDELGALERLLQSLPSCIRPGGRVGVISFHSLEDRLVKNAFRDRTLWEAMTRKPVQAAEEEIEANPRARSAKLRVARRIG